MREDVLDEVDGLLAKAMVDRSVLFGSGRGSRDVEKSVLPAYVEEFRTRVPAAGLLVRHVFELLALHQGLLWTRMHRKHGVSLGQACFRLSRARNRSVVLAKLEAVIGSQSLGDARSDLDWLVTGFNRHEIWMDYLVLAADLSAFPDVAFRMGDELDVVRGRWRRAFLDPGSAGEDAPFSRNRAFRPQGT